MEIKNELIKGIIIFFLILNIVTLGFGYYLIDNKFTEKKNTENLQLQTIVRKKESLLEEITIVNKSKEDIYANLKDLEQNITAFKV